MASITTWTSFAVNAIRRWWQAMGRARCPKATSLTITADGGGSNGARVRLWTLELQRLADQPGPRHHRLPPAARHQQVEQDRAAAVLVHHPELARAKPFVSDQVIVRLIAATTTKAGLTVRCETVRCELDPNSDPAGIKVADADFDGLNLQRHDVHGDWNDTISPRRDS